LTTAVSLASVRSPGLERLWDALPQARLVGGVVRDLLAGAPIADIDLATPEDPDRVQARLQAAGIKTVPTGLAHGTVTAIIECQTFEITTLRRDEETDGRHAVVAWTTDWREDAARRDFTINAMSCGRDGHVHDYFGGARDLATGDVRFVGEAALRIEEDALRILRFFRFTGRYGHGAPDAAALHAITQASDRLKPLSAERVWSELSRILTGPRADDMIALMNQAGVLGVLLPVGVDVPLFLRLLECGAPTDPILRLGALSVTDADSLSARLRLSRRERDLLAALPRAPILSPDMSDHDIARALAGVPVDILVRRSWLLEARCKVDADWAGLRTRLSNIQRPVFPLSGRDAVEAGVAPGVQVGATLRAVEDWWLAGGCVADKAACLTVLRTITGT